MIRDGRKGRFPVKAIAPEFFGGCGAGSDDADTRNNRAIFKITKEPAKWIKKLQDIRAEMGYELQR